MASQWSDSWSQGSQGLVMVAESAVSARHNKWMEPTPATGNACAFVCIMASTSTTGYYVEQLFA